VIACLDAGAYDSAARSAMAESNWLATGQLSPEDVKRMIGMCRGTQYTAKPMSEDPDTLKHELKPVIDGKQWFIRFYFVETPADVTMFISVHPSRF
jgi:hypothetical protein